MRIIALSLIVATIMLPGGQPVGAQTRVIVGQSLSMADVNRIIAVRVGEDIGVTLARHGGTDSQWRMVPAAGLSLVGPPRVIPVRGDGQAMAAATAIDGFTVRVTAPGELVLTFVDARTFGGPVQQADTATFVLDGR